MSLGNLSIRFFFTQPSISALPSPLNRFASSTRTTMFSGKLFTIFSAILAVAVNGSPVGFAEGELQAVRSPCGALYVDGGET